MLGQMMQVVAGVGGERHVLVGGEILAKVVGQEIGGCPGVSG